MDRPEAEFWFFRLKQDETIEKMKGRVVGVAEMNILDEYCNCFSPAQRTGRFIR